MSGFDVETLTLAEVEMVEQISRQAITAIADQEKPKGRSLAALAYVIKRREDSTFTFDQASQMTLSDAQALLDSGDEDTEDPTVPEPTDLPAESSAAPVTVTSPNSWSQDSSSSLPTSTDA